MDERKLLPSVSTALLLSIAIGTFEALAMYLGSGLFLNMMGISSVSKSLFRVYIRYQCIPIIYPLLTSNICILILISHALFLL
jgi:hypothetical protein